jgi:hypothetical protein
VKRFQRLFGSGDLFEDVTGRFGSNEGFGVSVVLIKITHDGALKFGDALEYTAAEADRSTASQL